MTQTHAPFRTAPAAIAAVLALSPLPLLAQEAGAPTAPVIVLPDVSAAAPTPVDPVTPTVSEPVVQAAPPAEPSTPLPSPDVAPPARQAPERALNRAAPAPVAKAAPASVPASIPASEPQPPAQTASLPADSAPAEAAMPINSPVATVSQGVPPQPVMAQDDADGALVPILGGVAALGLGLVGLAAYRRRKVRADDHDPAPVIRPRVVPTATVPAEPSAPIAPPPGQIQRKTPGAAVALPRAAPADQAERTALLRQMVDAAPDKANPFVHRKARTRRARLILQSLGHDFADRDPLFDVSDYPQNWPLVARRRYAAAA